MGSVIVRDAKGRVSFGPWDLVIQGLILVTLAAYAIETLPGLSEPITRALRLFELVTVGIFTGEYLLRVLLSRPPKSYVFSFYGVVDILAILPFYLSTGVDLRTLRAFRLLRLFRILKLARYSSAIQRFHRAFLLIREEMVLFGAAAGILLYLAAAGIYHFEHQAQPERFASMFHSLWWATTSLTTVGYGDVYPVTTGGKVFTFLVLVVGLGVVAVPTGLFAAALSKARDIEDQH